MIAENLHVGYHPKMKMRSYVVKKRRCVRTMYMVSKSQLKFWGKDTAKKS